jgi:perosamine synthetase
MTRDSAKFIPVAAPELDGREAEYVLDCVESTWISSKGEYITRFEEAFRDFSGAPHTVACNNGTSALHLALVALGIGPGDEVIVPTLTYIASANAVRYCGATPVFVDSLPDTWNLDPADVAEKLGPATKAIMPVHLFGNPAAMDPLVSLGAEHGVAIVEDAAEAHGARYRGRGVGTIGELGVFSFFGNKIITTGEGGMVVTGDAELARRALLYRGQGQSFERTYWFEVVGFNYRMTNIQAAIGLAQLEAADAKIARRQAVARRYREQLSNVAGITLQTVEPDATSAHWMVGVLLDVDSAAERDELAIALRDSGIETRPFFYPVHTMPPYVGIDPVAAEIPVAVNLSERGLCLPTWSGLPLEDVDFVCRRLGELLGGKAETAGVRPLSSTDADALLALFGVLSRSDDVTRHFHPHPWNDATARALVSYAGDDLYLGYFAGPDLLGYAMLRGWDEGYAIPSFGVVVRPDRQGAGIGSKLLAACLAAARERGAETVMLKVHRENLRAFEWYRSAGFEVVGEAEDGQLLCHLSLDRPF